MASLNKSNPFLSLPTEIVTHICRFVGKSINEDDNVVYSNKDFHALRRTCKVLYSKTTYDAGIRHLPFTTDFGVDFTWDGLTLLLFVSQNAQLRDGIERIELRMSDLEWSRWDDTLGKTAEGDYLSVEKQALQVVELEEWRGFTRSPEAFYMLVHIFAHLKHASQLEEIKVCCGHDTVLCALDAVQFDRKIATLHVHPKVALPMGQIASQNPTSFSPYIRGFRIHHRHPLISNNGDNRPTQPEYVKLIASMPHVAAVTIDGCGHYFKEWLSCDECTESYCMVMNIPYTGLTTIVITDMYLRGDILWRFINKIAGTLTTASFAAVQLTNMNWRYIFQAFQHADLKRLLLRKLSQERPTNTNHEVPSHWMEISAIRCKSPNIRRFLELMVEHHHVYIIRQRMWSATYGVHLFSIPGITSRYDEEFHNWDDYARG